MAISGVMLSFFLLIHLAGNSTLFFGGESFNSYARRLHSLGPLLHVFEVALLLVFLIHILTALALYMENLRARPFGYAIQKSAGGRSWGSRTKPYTGAMILVFLIIHMLNFRFSHTTIPSEAVKDVLSQSTYAVFYIISLTALGFHISHGFWSMFQTLGLNHPRYNRFLHISTLSLSILVSVLFILIPTLTLIYDHFLL